MSTAGQVEGYLSNLADVDALVDAVVEKHDKLDVLINNAGVFETPDGLDVRFVVNTIAPYRLTQRLSKLIGSNGRAINLSLAAQAPVNLDALAGKIRLSDMDAYAQSKTHAKETMLQWGRPGRPHFEKDLELLLDVTW